MLTSMATWFVFIQAAGVITCNELFYLIENSQIFSGTINLHTSERNCECHVDHYVERSFTRTSGEGFFGGSNNSEIFNSSTYS